MLIAILKFGFSHCTLVMEVSTNSLSLYIILKIQARLIQILVVQTIHSLGKWENPDYFGKDDTPTFFGLERKGVDFIKSKNCDVVNQSAGIDAFVQGARYRHTPF